MLQANDKNTKSQSSIITGKEPLTKAYLDILFSKPQYKPLDDNQLSKNYEKQCNNQLTNLDTRLEATNYKVNYIKQQLNKDEFERFQENKKEGRAMKAVQLANEKMQGPDKVGQLNVKDNIEESLLIIMSENKNLQLEIKQLRNELRQKNQVIEGLQKDLRQSKQREVLYQDEIINIKVEEQIRNEIGGIYNNSRNNNRNQKENNIYAQKQPLNIINNNSNINQNYLSPKIDNNNNNEDNFDFWGGQNSQLNEQNNNNNNLYNNNNNFDSQQLKKKQNQETLNEILGQRGNDNLWVSDHDRKKQEYQNQIQQQQQQNNNGNNNNSSQPVGGYEINNNNNSNLYQNNQNYQQQQPPHHKPNNQSQPVIPSSYSQQYQQQQQSTNNGVLKRQQY